MNKVFSLLSAMALVATPFYGAMQKKAEAKKSNPCECLESGMGLPSDSTCYAAGYNAPANIMLKDCVDITAQASFIYWYVGQDNMPVATDRHNDAAGNGHFNIHYPSFEFKPGFKIAGAIETKYDDWRLFAEYTWLHQSTHANFGTDHASWYRWLGGYTTTAGDYSVGISSKWKMHMDMLDWGFNRAFYRSKKITLSPMAGLRALWIRQNLHQEVTGASEGSEWYNMKSNSWAIGPVVGTSAHWLFDYGLRFEGKAGAALLYTRYSQEEVNVGLPSTYSEYNRNNFNAVRPMAELGMGMGWGMYFGQDYYFDLSARYDFNIFWNQNQMFETRAAQTLSQHSGDLFMHGLTLTARFDF